jgi:hypothetical protein
MITKEEILANAHSDESSNMCREYCHKKGFSYSNVTKDSFNQLGYFLNIELAKYLASEDRHAVQMNMRVAKIRKADITFNKEGYIRYGGIFIAGSYFDRREGIYFNADGFIGFCGWADGCNRVPIITAFVRWVDWLKDKQGADDE